ncbi:hypothetical protein ACHAWF_002746 [Thalassiosira exigua]
MVVSEYFTPLHGTAGGLLIGLSAATLLLFSGDVLGASGLMGSFAVSPKKTLTDPSSIWKLSFLACFYLVVKIYLLIDPEALTDPHLASGAYTPVVSPLGSILGGFLVGFGTRLGNGCTTGHGICGMARLSKRSFVGVCCFMGTGILSASLCSTKSPLYPYMRDSPESVAKYLPTRATVIASAAIASSVAVAALIGLLQKAPSESPQEERAKLRSDKIKVLPSALAATFFAVGLIVSQMTVVSKIYGFLDLRGLADGTWDPTLAFVMAGGLFVSFLSYQWVQGFGVVKNSRALECPLTQREFSVPTNKVIDKNLVVGELLFGFGWGAAGLCPGPAMVLACAGYQNILLRWWPMFYVGVVLAELVKKLQVRTKERRNSEQVADSHEPEKESEIVDRAEPDASDRSSETAGEDTYGACA